MVEKLKEANRKIEDLYNQRIEKAEHLAAFGELAAGLAHEVKNPLSGMKGALEIIGQNDAGTRTPTRRSSRRCSSRSTRSSPSSRIS